MMLMVTLTQTQTTIRTCTVTSGWLGSGIVFMLFCCSCPCCCCCCCCCCFVVIVVIVLLLLLLLLFLSLLFLLLLLFLFILLLPPSVILFCIKTKINTRPIRFLTPLSVVWLKGRMLPRMWQRKFESDQELRWQKQWVLFPGTKSVSKSMVSKKSNLGAQTASKAKLTLPTVEYTHFNHWWAKNFFRKVDNNWALTIEIPLTNETLTC